MSIERKVKDFKLSPADRFGTFLHGCAFGVLLSMVLLPGGWFVAKDKHAFAFIWLFGTLPIVTLGCGAAAPFVSRTFVEGKMKDGIRELIREHSWDELEPQMIPAPQQQPQPSQKTQIDPKQPLKPWQAEEAAPAWGSSEEYIDFVHGFTDLVNQESQPAVNERSNHAKTPHILDGFN